MTIGALDTDSRALAARLALQDDRSSFDLNDWVFSLMPPEPNQRWLDLGCGRGKQSVPLANLGASVTAVDLSQESLQAVSKAAPSVRTVCCGLDDIGEVLRDEQFDRAVGSYSLYYADDAQRLFENLRSMVTGSLFFCGPAHQNNTELRRLVGADLSPTKPSNFMEEIAPAICRELFADVQVFRFENEVTFVTAEEVMTYWRNHNLYDPAVEFEAPERFINRKRGIGVLAR